MTLRQVGREDETARIPTPAAERRRGGEEEEEEEEEEKSGEERTHDRDTGKTNGIEEEMKTGEKRREEDERERRERGEDEAGDAAETVGFFGPTKRTGFAARGKFGALKLSCD